MPPIGPRRALILLGSNIDPERHLPEAVRRLGEQLRLVAVSRVWESDPVGAPGTPRFLNAAVLVETELPPRRLKFGLLRPLEERLGRRRGADRNAPRTLDLDLALYDDLVVEEPDLVLPDPEILTRPYVALPLADAAPGFRHPVAGDTLATIAGRLADRPGIRVCARLDLRRPGDEVP